MSGVAKSTVGGAPWTIIGAGMGGKGLVAELGLQGVRLRVHDKDAEVVAPIKLLRGIHVEGRDRDFAAVELATTDLREAVQGAAVLLVCTYGNDHPDVARSLAPLLEDGQVVILVQGHLGGTLVFRRALERAGCRARVDVAEMDSYPYMHTVRAPDRVLLATTKARWHLAAHPATRTGAVMASVGVAFPGLAPAPNVLWTGLSDVGALLHVSGMITNIGRIESRETYNFYADAMTASVCNLLASLDAERVAVARAYGVAIPDIYGWLAETYHVRTRDLFEALHELARTHFRFAPAPNSLGHRYFVQDLGCGVVGMAALGRAADVATQVSDAVVRIGSVAAGIDFAIAGRSLDNLGLAGRSVQEIIALVSG